MRYDPSADYLEVELSSADGPFVTARAAAARVGLPSPDAVRRLVREGRLPARRASAGYNARLQIPEWAIDGWAEYVGRSRSEVRTPQANHLARIAELENALVVLRQAAEHEQRARRHLEAALAERGIANDLLSEALGAVVVPSVAAAAEARR